MIRNITLFQSIANRLLCLYSLPDDSTGQHTSIQNIYFRNDSMFVSSVFNGEDITLSTKIKNIGEMLFSGDSLFYLLYIDRPRAGIRFKGNFKGEEKITNIIIGSF